MPATSPELCAQCGAPMSTGQCMACMLGYAFEVNNPEPTPAGMRRFGDYEIEGKIARGGMGVVYRGRQISLKRPVAIKMIIGGELAEPEAVQRFHIEAEAAAKLRHPNIVSIYDVGECDHESYIAMELVTGGSLSDYQTQSPKATAALIEKVARALAYAHEHGVLHRDMKPSNILLDHLGEPRLSDFGLAKLMTHDHNLTTSNAMLGSPGYMAPEQAKQGEVTTAADIYGLGAVLYHLLAGSPPFVGATAMETLRMVADKTPPPLPAEVPRDLATICLKCLEKNPTARHASARDFADELQRFIRDEVILSRPVSRAEYLLRWMKRRPVPAALAATTMLAVLLGVSGVFWQWSNAENASAEQAKMLKHMHWQEVGQWLSKGDSARAVAYLASQMRENPGNWQAAMYAMSIIDDLSFPIPTGPPILPEVKLTQPACLCPSGAWVAGAGEDKCVRVWDTASGLELHRITTTSKISAIAVSDGDTALAIATETGQLLLYPTIVGNGIAAVRTDTLPIQALAFSTDGKTLMARCKDRVELYGAVSKSMPLEGGVTGAALSANGESVLIWNAKKAVVCESSSGRELLRTTANAGFRQGVIAANADCIALIDSSKSVRSWEVATQHEFQLIERKPQGWGAIALNEDGRRLTLAGTSNDLFVYDIESGLCVSPPMNHSYYLKELAISADGRRCVSLSSDDTASVWDAQTGRAVRSPVWQGRWLMDSTLGTSRNGNVVLTHGKAKGEWRESISIWRGTSPRMAQRRSIPGARSFGCSGLSPDGRLACLALVPESRCYLYEVATGKVVLNQPTNGEVYAPLFSPDGQNCYAFTGNGWLHGWSLKTGKALWEPVQQRSKIRPAAISADGAQLVAGYTDGYVRVHDAQTGKMISALHHGEEIRSLRFAPHSSTRFISSGMKGIVRLWNLPSDQPMHTLSGHNDLVLSTAWSPDGKTVATASYDTTVRLWNAATGRQMGSPLPHSAVMSHLEFSPDGKILATACRDGTVRLWRVLTGEPLTEPIKQGQTCEVVRFTADGAALLARDLNGFCFYDTAKGEPVTRYYSEPVETGLGIDSEPTRSIMNPDGSMVFLAYSMDDGALWSIEQPRGQVPAWFPDLLETLAFMRVESSGLTTPIPATQFENVRRQALDSRVDDCYSRWAKKLIASPVPSPSH